MSTEKELFSRWRETLARRYGKILGEESVQRAHENLVSSYENFVASDCADPHFSSEICSSDSNKSAQRLGEMLLYEKLINLGLNPISKPKGPDFLIEISGRYIWLELVTPSIGDDYRIGDLFEAHDPLSPCPEQATELKNRLLLRISSAISSKLVVYEKYLRDGVVPSTDPLIIVINDALLCPDSSFYGVSHGADKGIGGGSLAEHAVNGIGASVWAWGQDAMKYELQDTFRNLVENRPEPKKDGGPRQDVPVSLFVYPTEPHAEKYAQRATIISAVLQMTLREDYGLFMLFREKAKTEDRLFETLLSGVVFVENPRANNPVDVQALALLKTNVLAPALSAKELWDLQNRRLKLLFGDLYKVK